jgi:ketosteroid isomerase-like protein
MSRRLAALALAAAAGLAHAADADDAVAATARLYAAMDARDLAGVSALLPAAGFTELSPTGERHRLDAKAVAALFATPLVIDLHATDLQAETVGDTTIVTGTRTGAVAPAGTPAPQAGNRFTMVWTKADGRWQLRHVHLSPAG